MTGRSLPPPSPALGVSAAPRLALLLAALSCIAAFPVRADEAKAKESVDEAAKRVLTTKFFPFCVPSDEPMVGRERAWCDIAGEASTCPEIKAMCERPEPPQSFFSSLFKRRAGKVDSDTAGGATDRLDWVPKFNLPGAQVLFWILIGVIVAVFLVIVIRAMRERRQSIPVPGQDEPAETAIELPDPGLSEVGRLLALARKEVDRDVGRALMLLYAAILRHLEDHRLIHWDVTTTNREYVRAVRGKTPLDRPMAEVVREVERTKFGRRTPRRETFEALYEKVSPLLKAAAVLLVLLGTVSCSGCEPGDAGLDGHAAISDILRTQGISPSRLAGPLDNLGRNDPPVILDARDFLLDTDTLQAIEKATLRGARIMVLLAPTQWMPAWPGVGVAEEYDSLIAGEFSCDLDAGVAEEAADAGVAVAPATPSTPVITHEAKPGPLITPTSDWARESQLSDDSMGFLPGAYRIFIPPDEKDLPDVLLERDGDPFAVRWQTEDGELILVADRRLFSNAAMAVPTNARLAVALTRELAAGKPEISYGALTLNRAAPSPSASLMNAGLLAFMLQMLLVLAVGFASRGLAFGALRDRTVVGRRAFSEHVQALGLQFARVKGSRFATAQYAAYALERFRSRLGHDLERSNSTELAGVLARRIGRDESEVRETIAAAEAARREPNGFSVPETDLALIHRLGDYLSLLQRDV